MNTLNQVAIVGKLIEKPEVVNYEPASKITRVLLTMETDLAGSTSGKNLAQCEAVGKIAEQVIAETDKGSVIGVTGRVSTRRHGDSEGNIHYTTSVIADSIQYFTRKEKSKDKTIVSETESEKEHE